MYSSGFTKSTAAACQQPMEKLTPGHVKKVMEYKSVHEEEQWRPSLILKLLDDRQDKLDVPIDLMTLSSL